MTDEILTRAALKDYVVRLIEDRNGVKATELVDDFNLISSASVLGINVADFLEELVHEGRIAEIEYVVPAVAYRIKSFFLPIGSKVNCLNNLGDEHD